MEEIKLCPKCLESDCEIHWESPKELKKLEEAMEACTRKFCLHYFETGIYDWVGDEIGGVFRVGDCFFSFDFVVGCMRLKYNFNKLYKKD